MNKSPIDPAGHIIIAVKNIKESKQFYKKIFTKLGIRQIAEKETAWELFTGFCLWIKQAQHPNYSYKFHSPGLHHICIKVKSKKAVDEFYTFLLQQKILIYDKPKAYPKYTKNYYAVFFTDPDGIKLEVAYY